MKITDKHVGLALLIFLLLGMPIKLATMGQDTSAQDAQDQVDRSNEIKFNACVHQSTRLYLHEAESDCAYLKNKS